MDYKKQMLKLLVDKYEKSKAFKSAEKPARRIILKMYHCGKTEFQPYDIENSDIRQNINNLVAELTECGFIYHEWVKGEENHILSKIWLNYDALGEVYKYLGHRPKSELMKDLKEESVSVLYKVHTEWIISYLKDVCAELESGYTGNLPADKKEREDLFKALAFIDSNTENDILERVFSMACFGSSKRFENSVKNWLLRILRKYLEDAQELRDDELLRFIGIIKYPEQFEFSGNVRIFFEKGMMDYGLVKFGSVNAADFTPSRLKIDENTKRIITIENKANYNEYVLKNKGDNEIVIYHGGQYSLSKKRFFQAFSAVIPGECTWFHWGDIDWGGFGMLARLRREILSDIKPYRMNKEELIRYKKFAGSFDAKYAEKLRELSQRRELADVKDCLLYMIEHGIRLEQEAMLIDNV